MTEDIEVTVEQPEVLLTVEDAETVDVNAGIPGPRGERGPVGPAGGAALTVTAGAALGGHRMVVLDGAGLAIYADCGEPTHAGKVLGMTLGAAEEGAAVDVLRMGEVVEPSWNWTLDAPVFLGTAGQLTQTQPVSGFSLVVGFSVAPTKLFVSLREPITLL